MPLEWAAVFLMGSPLLRRFPTPTLETGSVLCQSTTAASKPAGLHPGGRVTITASENGGTGMNIFKALAVKDVDEATRAIPLIDVGPASRGERGAVEAAAQEIRRACERVGFFYLAGHGVPQPLIDDAFAASREFHAIPLDSKAALKINENNIGYLAVNQSMQRHSTVHQATRPNFNESFFISHDRGADHPDVAAGVPLRGRNQWPAGR